MDFKSLFLKHTFLASLFFLLFFKVQTLTFCVRNCLDIFLWVVGIYLLGPFFRLTNALFRVKNRLNGELPLIYFIDN